MGGGFYEKFDWVLDDYISKGYVDTLETVSEAVREITSEDIIDVLDEVFNIDNIKIGKGR